MIEVLSIILLFIFVWWHNKNINQKEVNHVYFLGLIFKIIAGMTVGLLYTYYYQGGDTWLYFNQAKLLSDVAFHSFSNFIDIYIYNDYHSINELFFGRPRFVLMVKLVALVNLITHTNYWITSAYFSFFSFIGLWKFSYWVYTSFSNGKNAAIILFIWPSFVFWSSGVLKETIAVGLILWIIPTYFQILKSKSIGKVILLILAIYLLFSLKYYFSIVLITVLFTSRIMMFPVFAKKNYSQQSFIWILLLSVVVIPSSFLHPNLNLNNVLEVIIANNKLFITISKPESIIHFIDNSSDWIWLIINIPKALFSGLFMPLNFRYTNLLYSLSSIENWLLLGLFIRALYIVKVEDLKTNFNLILGGISYITILAIFLTLSAPNLGTLSRYRVSFIPIFLVLIFSVKIFAKNKNKK